MQIPPVEKQVESEREEDAVISVTGDGGIPGPSGHEPVGER